MTIVSTSRLDLISMDIEFLDALIEADYKKAATLAKLSQAPEWEGGIYGLELRRNQLSEDPTLKPWLLRRIILRKTNVMVGHIGFQKFSSHIDPQDGPEDILEFSPNSA